MSGYHETKLTGADRKSGSAGMPRPISYAVFCLKKKHAQRHDRAFTEPDVRPPGCARQSACSLRAGEGGGYGCVEDRLGVMPGVVVVLFFFNDTATTEIYTLPLHDALPISKSSRRHRGAHRHPQNRAVVRRQKFRKSKIGRAVQQECRDRYRMPSSA